MSTYLTQCQNIRWMEKHADTDLHIHTNVCKRQLSHPQPYFEVVGVVDPTRNNESTCFGFLTLFGGFGGFAPFLPKCAESSCSS